MPAHATESSSGLGHEIFRLAVETCPSGILVVDAADGRIVLVNEEIERLFGYDREELLGQPVEILVPEQFRDKHPRHRRRYSTQPIARRMGAASDLSGRRKDGSEFPIEVGLNPLKIGGELMVVGAIVDLSERRRLEQMQDAFVAVVSHELRTPMTSIAASLGLLLAGGAQGLPPPTAHLLGIAHANCGRLIRLLNDILDIKKLEAGQMPFHFQRLDARSLLEKAVEANRGFAESFGVHFETRSDPVELYVDADRFIQAITNLLSNAVKYSPQDGTVSVAIDDHGDKIRVSVRDRGPGIPDEFKPQVFDKFTQADSAGGQLKGGTGLGLSIAREIVTRMHGQIGFGDAADGGTVFYVDIPNADRAERWHAGFKPAMPANAEHRASGRAS